MTHSDDKPCEVYIDGGWWGTDWDDPLIAEEAWVTEQNKVFLHFYDIEYCLNSDDIPF